jgi:type VI protein secretion system component VasK
MQLTESDNPNHANPPATSALHSWVYLALIGLALWMVLWVWSFVGNGETDYILFIVTGFIVTVVALQVVLMRVRRADKTSDSTAQNGTAQDSTTQDSPAKGVASFREWARGVFEAERSRMRAGEAALLILLPIAAAAIGMMAFGIEYMIVEHAAGM